VRLSDQQPAVVVHLPSRGQPLLTKRQLATALGRSTRWVELRMREGMPVLPRRSPSEHTRFELTAVREWLELRAERRVETMEERVARLERDVARLTRDLVREER
jgi:phage terminase Nu1 subunit (DNA packaging protein)